MEYYYRHIMFFLTKNENGEVESGEPDAGMTPDWSITEEEIDAIIKSCQKFKKKFPTAESRELARYKWIEENEEREKARIKKDRAERLAKKGQRGEKSLGRQCHIYLIRDTIRGYCKIGRATNYFSRFRALQTANPAIELLLVYAGFQIEEAWFHKYFSNKGKHIGGEWFDLNKDDVVDMLCILENSKKEIIYINDKKQ